MLSKTVIFLFVFLGLFALFLTTIPGQFLTSPFSPKYISKEVREQFKSLDVIMYSNAKTGTISYPDPPLAFEFGLPIGQYLEFDWVTTTVAQYTIPFEAIYLRHLVAGFGGYWYDYHNLELYYENNTKFEFVFGEWCLKENLVNAWDSTKNASIFYASCPHIMTSVIMAPWDASWTIAESWDNEKLNYTLSYQWNPNSTVFSAFTLLAQLLTFQSPNLGVPGIFGQILNYLIAAPIWAMIAYLIFKFITGIIPFLSGGSGD